MRDLIRVGLDNIKGYATPAELKEWDGELQQIEVVDFDELNSRSIDQNVQILDVRKATEYDEAHIPAARNIAHTRLAAQLDELSKEREVMVHCASGRRASYASSLLASEGYKVHWVDDNFSDWQKKYGQKAREGIST